MKKRNGILLIIVCIAAACLALAFAACATDGYSGGKPVPDTKENEVLFIEHNRLTFALGMEIDEVKVLESCNIVFYDNGGNEFKVTAASLSDGTVSHDSFDLSEVGSDKQIAISYNGVVNYIYYDVNDYTAHFYLDEEQTELYKTVKAQAAITDTLGLAVWVNLIEYNYSTDEDAREMDEYRAERFDGWYDSSSNRATGLYSLAPPLNGNEREISFHAHYISDEDFNNLMLSYDAAGRRVFSGYKGGAERVRIPEGVTYIDLSETFKNGSPFKSMHIPSTASMDVPLMSGVKSTGLETVTVDSGNRRYAAYNGAVYSKDYSTLYFMPSDCKETSFHSELSVVESYACAYWRVSELTIPDGIVTLKHYCFSHSLIETVTGLEKVKTIMAGVFYNSALSSVRDGVAEYIVLTGQNEGKLILSMVLDDTVTEYALLPGTIGISGDAFTRCAALKSVDFGSELESIGGSAFSGCVSLESVTFPSTLKKMGSSVFYGCTALASANGLPVVTYVDDAGKEHGSTLPYGLFRGCTALTEFIIPSGVTSIGQSVFYNCTALTDVVIPDTVTVINAYSFYGCSALTGIELPAGLRALGSYAFGSCGLTAIDLSVCKGLTSLPDYCFRNSKLVTISIPDWITAIPYRCFYTATSLTTITFNNVKVIEDEAFAGCSKLAVIDFDGVEEIGYQAFLQCSAITEVVLPDSVRVVGGYAFRSCAGLLTISVGKNVEQFGYYSYLDDGLTFDAAQVPVYACSKIKAINVAEDNPYFNSIDGVIYGRAICGIEYGEGSVLYCLPRAKTGTLFESAPTTRIVAPYALHYQAYMTTCVFNEGVENIGKAAFYNATKLNSVSLPSTVSFIGAGILLNCANVTSFTIADGNKVYSTDGNLVYKGSALSMYLGLSTDINIKDGTTEIESAVFMDNKNITEITIPDSVTTIGVKAFSGCSNITALHIGSGLRYIDPSAFALLSSLETITVSADNPYFTVENNILYSKDYKSLVLVAANNGMTELNIRDTVTEIRDYAFSYHKTLSSVVMPSGLKTVGNYAFYECRGITKLICSEALESIGNYAFAFDASSASNVDSRRCCDALRYIIFYGNLKTVGDFAFNGQFGIEKVFYKMTIAELETARRGFGANSVFFTLGCKNDETGGYYNNDGEGIIRALYSAVEPTIDYNGYEWFYFDDDGNPTLY
ncbi:MAG: leucine-rich repeat domain-containing protein [Clostridiales bacterium]|nr:leucine-rich repeat domain-containing protein [Clostridiales bacterium]